MKILHVLHQFLPEKTGGIELYTRNLSRILIQSGNQVAIFCGDGDVIWHHEKVENTFDDLDVVRVQNRKSFKKGHFSFFKSFRNKTLLSSYEQLLKDFQPDIIHFHHTMYLSGQMIHLAKRKGIPIVITIHDFWLLCHKLHLVSRGRNQCSGPGKTGFRCSFCIGAETRGFLRWIRACLFFAPVIYRTRYHLRLLHNANILVVPAIFVGDLLEGYLTNGKKQIIHLPYGIPHTTNLSIKKVCSEKIRFAYLGAIKKHKGLHLLINAFNGLTQHNTTLHIYGDYNIDKLFYSQLIDKLQNDQVSFKGPYKNEEVNRLFKEIDVLIVPSIWRETGPMVVLEALAHQTPVIGSNLGGIAELIGNSKNGFLFEYGNVESLQKCVGHILDNPNTLLNLLPQLDDEHTIQNNATKLCDIYHGLISSDGR